MPRFFGSLVKIRAVGASALAALSFGVISFGLAACGPAENDPGPGGVTVGEARALDEAAEMLDERQANPDAATGQAGQDATDSGEQDKR